MEQRIIRSQSGAPFLPLTVKTQYEAVCFAREYAAQKSRSAFVTLHTSGDWIVTSYIPTWNDTVVQVTPDGERVTLTDGGLTYSSVMEVR